ncbi:MAG: DUF3426 domain-containing protein [Alphaproteobacteria bacterium]|jgi:hypothetical protein|nr:DUF3426 domain-containing protein [Alphaproteobacteria bacterium]
MMKIKCDVCKTEYSMPDVSSGRVRCAVCGNVWHVSRKSGRNSLLVFFAALCALLAATMFAVVVIISSRRDDPEKRPLVATITDVSTINEDENAPKIVVNGTVTNRSDDIYAFPDLIIVLYGADGAPISRQKFMPSATLLDAGQSVRFSHTLSGKFNGVKRVTVELLDTNQGEKK